MNVKVILVAGVIAWPGLAFAETNPMSQEAKRLFLEGWDMSLCRQLPFSRYQSPAPESDLIPVKFFNDTGAMILPAYLDLKGRVTFLNSKKPDAVWNDKTRIGNYYVWFKLPGKCMGISPAKYEWSEKTQIISQIAEPT